MKLHVKNMVCDRCKIVIRSILQDMGVTPESVTLGEIDLGDRAFDGAELSEFTRRIESVGFELISDKKSRLIASIRELLISLIRDTAAGEVDEKVKLSEYLASQLHHDYGYLSHLFSSVEGITIEQAFILQKIEKTKELLVYDELTLTEIADQLGYSSVAHLSRQFKQITGFTPTAFKQMRGTDHRQALDQL